MKILILASRPLEHSGITKIEMDVIDYIGNLVDIIVACPFGFMNEYGKKLREKNIECIDLPSKSNTIRYMKAISKLVKEKNIDKVYISGNSAMMIFEALPASVAGSTVITHCHNTKSDYPLINYLSKPMFNLVVDKKIGVSELASKWAYLGKNIITIPNGVDLKKFHVDFEARDEIRASLGFEDAHVFGHIGTFNKQKNHIRLIEIFLEIIRNDKDAVLLLIGDGVLKDNIKKMVDDQHISDKVKFIDFTTEPEKYYQAIDVLIMPSLHEGLCLAALEAQACSVPTLVSDVFAKETFVTSKCQKLSLNDSNIIWAKKAISMISTERNDMSKVFIGKRMDYDSMMSSIATVLLK